MLIGQGLNLPALLNCNISTRWETASSCPDTEFLSSCTKMQGGREKKNTAAFEKGKTLPSSSFRLILEYKLKQMKLHNALVRTEMCQTSSVIFASTEISRIVN